MTDLTTAQVKVDAAIALGINQIAVSGDAALATDPAAAAVSRLTALLALHQLLATYVPAKVP